MSDGSKIRNQHGAREARSWSRRNVLLFLRDVQFPTSQAGQRLDLKQAYLDAAATALREADQPEGIMDLTRFGAGDGLERVLGNREAGRLFEAVYNHISMAEGTNQQFMDRVNQVSDCLPIDPNNPQIGVSRTLRELVGPEPFSDSARWAWTIMRRACRSWFDVRVRSLRESGWWLPDGSHSQHGVVPLEQLATRLAIRTDQVNATIHGADVRLDAFMCQLKQAGARYGHWSWDPFVEILFQHRYGMSSEEALYLCKSTPF